MTKATLRGRFEAKYEPEPNTGCWLWTGHQFPKGYGAIYVDERNPTGYAHRVSYELNVGPIPAGLCVLHHCDTPACVRPDHLFLGTKTDNSVDMVAKGRHKVPVSRYRNATHCIHGHLFDTANTYIVRTTGARRCRACARARRAGDQNAYGRIEAVNGAP